MSEKKSDHAIVLVLTIAAIYLLWSRYQVFSGANAANQTASGGVGTGGTGYPNFTTPYMQTTPGIYDNVVNMFGNTGQPFVSDIQVNLTNNPLSQLTQKYIPLYGFVGMAAP